MCRSTRGRQPESRAVHCLGRALPWLVTVHIIVHSNADSHRGLLHAVGSPRSALFSASIPQRNIAPTHRLCPVSYKSQTAALFNDNNSAASRRWTSQSQTATVVSCGLIGFGRDVGHSSFARQKHGCRFWLSRSSSPHRQVTTNASLALRPPSGPKTTSHAHVDRLHHSFPAHSILCPSIPAALFKDLRSSRGVDVSGVDVVRLFISISARHLLTLPPASSLPTPRGLQIAPICNGHRT